MKTLNLTPDDPRLTAYALGELSGEEAAAVAAAVESNPALQEAVTEIRDTMGLVEHALAEEPMPKPMEMALADEPYPLDDRKVTRFPYFWVSGVMAAGFAIMMVVMDSSVDYEANEVADQTISHELDLSTMPVDYEDAAGGVAVALPIMAREPDRMEPLPQPRESYAEIRENRWTSTADETLSTFAIDVDSGSYANVRRFLRNGELPPADAVRVEELINAFDYDYAPPVANDADAPFAAHLEVASAPWSPDHRLVRIGLKGREVTAATRGRANLVFLLDVSGSMEAPNKLPLVKESLRLLVAQLRPDDRVSIVTYAGSSGLALPSTPASRAEEILEALDRLQSAGSTNGAMGIHLAYDIARANFVPGGINRVVLCTDGDFNVGATSSGDLGRLIEEKARSGVFLTSLGFGMGDYQDETLEQLANRGNGHYGYIDTLREARRLLVEQVNGTLATIAKDVKVQVEFNPAQVAAYRLIGYENRLLAKQDFNNDAVDGGEIGAGHTVTALYEIIPAGKGERLDGEGWLDPRRYASGAASVGDRVPAAVRNELLTVRLRAKSPASDKSQRWEFPLTDSGKAFAAASPDFKFASAVAGFGLVLRDSPHCGSTHLDDVVAWAEAGIASDPGGYRREFIDLVREAQALGLEG